MLHILFLTKIKKRMKNTNGYLIVLCSLLLLAITACGEEKKKASQESADQEEFTGKAVEPNTLLENEYAQVVKIRLTPGDFQATHAGNERLVYALTDYSIDWEEQGENLGTKTWKAGEVHFHEAGEHAAKNNGTQTAEWLVFSRKNIELPECGENAIGNDVSSVRPEFTKALFENERFRLVEVTLPPGESIPSHSGINRIVYSLSAYQITYSENEEQGIEKQFSAGDVHWHQACQHSLSNTGDSVAKYLVVSYK
jgi:quercetin dioxygenase-like cupin family protein